MRFGFHHKGFCDIIDDPKRAKKKNIIAPRRSAKSVFFVEANITHKVYYKSLSDRIGEFADQYILVVSRGKRLAMRRIAAVRKILESNFPHLVDKTRVWGKEEYETANDTLILALSRGGALRGETFNTWRLTLIICDDVDDRESLRNPQRVEDDWEWFNNDLLPAGDEDYTNVFVCDTIKGTEAISNKLQKSTEWDTHFWRAIPEPAGLIHPKHETVWEDYRRIYKNLMQPPEIRRDTRRTFFSNNTKSK